MTDVFVWLQEAVGISEKNSRLIVQALPSISPELEHTLPSLLSKALALVELDEWEAISISEAMKGLHGNIDVDDNRSVTAILISGDDVEGKKRETIDKYNQFRLLHASKTGLEIDLSYFKSVLQNERQSTVLYFDSAVIEAVLEHIAKSIATTGLALQQNLFTNAREDEKESLSFVLKSCLLSNNIKLISECLSLLVNLSMKNEENQHFFGNLGFFDTLLPILSVNALTSKCIETIECLLQHNENKKRLANDAQLHDKLSTAFQDLFSVKDNPSSLESIYHLLVFIVNLVEKDSELAVESLGRKTFIEVIIQIIYKFGFGRVLIAEIGLLVIVGLASQSRELCEYLFLMDIDDTIVKLVDVYEKVSVAVMNAILRLLATLSEDYKRIPSCRCLGEKGAALGLLQRLYSSASPDSAFYAYHYQKTAYNLLRAEMLSLPHPVEEMHQKKKKFPLEPPNLLRKLREASDALRMAVSIAEAYGRESSSVAFLYCKVLTVLSSNSAKAWGEMVEAGALTALVKSAYGVCVSLSHSPSSSSSSATAAAAATETEFLLQTMETFLRLAEPYRIMVSLRVPHLLLCILRAYGKESRNVLRIAGNLWTQVIDHCSASSSSAAVSAAAVSAGTAGGVDPARHLLGQQEERLAVAVVDELLWHYVSFDHFDESCLLMCLLLAAKVAEDPVKRAVVCDVSHGSLCDALVAVLRHHGTEKHTDLLIVAVAAITSLCGHDGCERFFVLGGCPRLVTELVIRLAADHEALAVQLLRAIAVLASKNKSLLGEMEACELVAEVIFAHCPVAGSCSDAVALHGSTALYNLCTDSYENKGRGQASVIADYLQALMRNDSISTSTKQEIKDAINAVKFMS